MKNIIFSVLLGILSSPLTCVASETTDKAIIIDEILYSGLLVNPELNEEGVISSLGKPIRSVTKQISNKHHDTNDELTYLYYSGIEILIYTTKGLEHNWSKVTKVIIYSKNDKLPHGLNIGASKTSIIKILGNPHQIHNNKWYYFASDGEPHLQLIIELKSEFVNKLSWSYMP